jgi:small-conductance mechanosensitive channel
VRLIDRRPRRPLILAPHRTAPIMESKGPTKYRPLDPKLDTRLRVVRRLLVLVIVVVVGLFVLVQFGPLKRLATGLLASTALLGLVVGFAAQHLLGNLVAGILIAFGDPIHIGDRLQIGDDSGRVRDITLTYTRLDMDDGRLLQVPNGMLLTSAVTIGEPGSKPEYPS